MVFYLYYGKMERAQQADCLLCSDTGYRIDTKEHFMQDWKEKFDALSLERGENLWENGCVSISEHTDTKIQAAVRGQAKSPNNVFIMMEDGQPVRMRCQCPKYRGGKNCEHMAAVLYGIMEGDRLEQKQKEQERIRLEQQKIAFEKAEQLAQKKRDLEEQERLEREEQEAAEQQRLAVMAEAERIRKEENRKRIEQRKAEKAAKKAEIQRKRKAAEEAERAAREAEALAKQEEEQKRQQEEERRQQQEEYRQVEDDYQYFDLPSIRASLELSAAKEREGRKLRQRGDVRLEKVSSGYVNNIDEMVGEVNGTGRRDGRSFPITILFDDNQALRASCDCPECKRNYYSWYSGECKCRYVAGMLQELEEYLREHSIGDATDRTGAFVLTAFQEKHANQVMADAREGENSLRLEPKLVRQDDSLQLSFCITADKTFVIKDLIEFCRNVHESLTATYGSKTQINHKLTNFDERSREWFSFIERIMQEETMTERRLEQELKYYYHKNRKCRSLELYGWRLDQFYQIMGKESVAFEDKTEGGRAKQRIISAEEQPRIKLSISRSGKGKVFRGIDVSCSMPVFYTGTEYFYYISGQTGQSSRTLCRTNKSQLSAVMPMIEEAEDGELDFQVGRNRLQDFYYTILPRIQDVVEVQEQDYEEIRKYLPPEVQFTFYLDAETDYMTCRVHSFYGNREYSLLDLLKENVSGVLDKLRMEDRESEILFRTMQLFPEIDFEADEFLCERSEDAMYHILEYGLEELADMGEVQCTRRFQNLSIIRSVKVSVGVSVSDGLLNLDIATDDISREDLLDILKSYRARKKYHRLKNGSFLNLEDGSLQILGELMESLHLSPKEFVKGKMHLPMYRTLYLDKMLEENEQIYAARDSRFRSMVKNFKTVADADYEVPKSLRRVLRGYQKRGYQWLRTLESCRFGGILADEMGLGKTLQVIAVLLAAREERETIQDTLSGYENEKMESQVSLVVSPASLVYNWEEELKRFAPSLKVLPITGTQTERQHKLEKYRDFDVLLTSYDLLKRDIDQYEDKSFAYEIIDEAQYIKNHTTAASKAVKVIRSRVRYALTGTPIENRLSELWSIFDYLMPGFLYGYDVFKKDLETPIVKYQEEEKMQRLQKMVGPFILRRLKTDVLKDLPDKLEENRYVQMEEIQRQAYDAQVVHMQQQIAQQDNAEFNKNKMQILAELTRLRQICCDPSLCFENYRGESAKLESCIELINSALDGGHKILLFSQFTSMLDILEQRLKKEKISHYMITGATPKEQRLKLVKAFNEDQTQVFLISLKAGGVGLNLTGADIVIHYDPWWNVAVQNQATDRAHRIGQTRKVTVYKMIARGTIEEKIQKLQETKKNLADQIVNSEMGQLGGMSREELLELLT